MLKRIANMFSKHFRPTKDVLSPIQLCIMYLCIPHFRLIVNQRKNSNAPQILKLF